MTDPRAKFEQALAAYAVPGARWSGSRQLTYWGAACGMNADEVVEAAHGAGVTSRESDANIRRGMVTAAAKVQANAAKYRTRPSGGSVLRCVRAKPKPQTFPMLVRQYIEAGRDVSTVEGLRRLSPQRICRASDPLARRVQCEQQMLALFGRNEITHMRETKDDHAAGRIGANMRTAEGWTRAQPHPVDAFEIIRANPFTGKRGTTASGAPSYMAQDCVAAFRHMLCEFDAMPIVDQCRFWAGFVRCSPLAARLACIVHSGNKSLHAALRVDAADLDAWSGYKARVAELFAADPDPHYRLDVQALAPLAGMRLAGAVRRDTREVQALAYVRRDWFDADWQRELNPPAPETSRAEPSPPPPADDLAAHCAACAVADDCKSAFGAYWNERSRGGIGCVRPFHGWKRADAPGLDHAAFAAQGVLPK